MKWPNSRILAQLEQFNAASTPACPTTAFAVLPSSTANSSSADLLVPTTLPPGKRDLQYTLSPLM